MKSTYLLLSLVIFASGCTEQMATERDYQLNAAFRAVDPETRQPQLWLAPEQAVPVLRYVVNEYSELCDELLCEYKAQALLNVLPQAPLGSPQYELARYAATDTALGYVVDDLFPLHIQVHEETASGDGSRVIFIETANSDEPGEMVESSQGSVAVITASDGKLFRALASGHPDEMLAVDCVTDGDRKALAGIINADIDTCEPVDVEALWAAETNRLLDKAKHAWKMQDHMCDERPCHGLYPVEFFGETRYALINWGQFERFVDQLDYQVCANQEHTNVWACLLDISQG